MRHALLQSLESRRLFSFVVVDNVLTVQGTTRADTITLGWQDLGGGNVLLRAFDGRRTTEWTIPSAAVNFTSVYIYAGNGDDTIHATFDYGGAFNLRTPPLPVSINGGGGSDRISATDNADTIVGGSRSDTIDAGGGADSIRGEGGPDRIRGGTGNDTVRGDGGADRIEGGDGDDRIFGGSGDDRLDGGEDDDLIQGGGGADDLYAGSTANGPFFRGANEDFDFDTLWGSASNRANDQGDEIFL